MCYLAIRHTGSIQQGRYFLPLAVSLPIICGALSTQAGLPAAAANRLATAVPFLAATGQTAAAYWSLRRYTVGSTGPLTPTASVTGVWHPPVPAWFIDLGFLVLWAAIAILAALGARSLAGRRTSTQVEAGGAGPGINGTTAPEAPTPSARDDAGNEGEAPWIGDQPATGPFRAPETVAD